MLFRGTQDGRVLAYDFKTGKRIWQTTPKTRPSQAIGKGHMFALDANTGKIVWEFILVPKAEGDVVRGPKAKALLDELA
jgi:alcohol dehydrogenase (cytochrome c)